MEYSLEIDENEIFKTDQLNREPYIKGLMNVFEYSSEHKVVAINAPWGTGKTTLIRLWEKYLDKNYDEFVYVTFNAWENDDSEDPLLALTLTIAEQLGTEERKHNLIALGSILTRTVVKIGTHGVLNLAELNLSDGITTDIANAFEKASGEIYESFISQKKTKQLFKETLIKLCEDYKLIIFIDELDRCRPTFAIETLERIKHFFDIPRCYFVLAVDREQLGYSIETIYGSEMDTTGYLRRFFDLEMNLYNSTVEQYFNFRFSNLENENFKQLLLPLIQQNNFSLRDIDKLYQLSTIIVPQLKIVEIGDYHLSLAKLSPYCSFIVCKIKYPELYQTILNKKYVINEDFSVKISKIIISNEYNPDGEIVIDYHSIVYNILSYYLHYDEEKNDDSYDAKKRWEVTVKSYNRSKYDTRIFFKNGGCNIFETLEMFQLTN